MSISRITNKRFNVAGWLSTAELALRLGRGGTYTICHKWIISGVKAGVFVIYRDGRRVLGWFTVCKSLTKRSTA